MDLKPQDLNEGRSRTSFQSMDLVTDERIDTIPGKPTLTRRKGRIGEMVMQT